MAGVIGPGDPAGASVLEHADEAHVLSELDEATAPKAIVGKSPGQLAWARLKRDRTACASAIVLFIFIFVAVAAPLIEWVYGYKWNLTNSDLLDPGGFPLGYGGGIDWSGNNPSHHAHILGVMPLTGNDLFMYLVQGVRTSLIIAGSASLIAVLIGIVVGVVAGYYGKWVDQTLSWFIDYMLCFPFLLMAISMIPIINSHLSDETGDVTRGKRMLTIIIIFAFFTWMQTARIVRGQVISLREREYVEAARAAGAGGFHIMFKQILPNLWAPILVTFSLLLPAVVVGEAALSFLGIGLTYPQSADFGWSINDSLNYMRNDPWYLLFPGLGILALVLAFNLFGDTLRDALDPKSGR